MKNVMNSIKVSIKLKLKHCRNFIGLACVVGLAGCSTYGTWLPSSGPSTQQVVKVQASPGASNVEVIEVTDAVARRVVASQQRRLFSETIGTPTSKALLIGSGDVLETSIWESPPAALFGSGAIDPRGGASTTRATLLADQVVNSSGQINVPFAGAVQAAGRSPQQIEAEILQRLKGKANSPQVVVRLAKNAASNVTVVGEFASSTRMPLTAVGERLLDAVAAAGGVRQPVGKMTIQVTRGSSVQSLPLEIIIQDPLQNIFLQPGDVVTALFQPLSFTVLGATGKNEELNFETQGISLAQALARAGGLQDARADARGVFIFRFEDPLALDPATATQAVRTLEGKVPVVYRVDLKDPATFFVAQGFPIRNKDVLYVSNSPAVELQKFLNIIGTLVFPIAAVRSVVQ